MGLSAEILHSGEIIHEISHDWIVQNIVVKNHPKDKESSVQGVPITREQRIEIIEECTREIRKLEDLRTMLFLYMNEDLTYDSTW